MTFEELQKTWRKINVIQEMEKRIFTADGIITNTAYMAAFAIERMMIVLDRRLRTRGAHLVHEKKRNFTMLRRSIEAVRRYYDLAFDEDLVTACESSGRMSDYDGAHEDANEIARLLLLYVDRCGYNQDNYERLFRLLRSMEGGTGVITDEVIGDFYMKK